MSSNREIGIRKHFESFVDGLSYEESKRQLVLAYVQMERCIDALRGHDVEPVDMLDSGMNSDLELFYLCLKMRAEYDDLKHSVNGGIHSIKYSIDIDTSELEESLARVKSSLSEIDSLYGRISSSFN